MFDLLPFVPFIILLVFISAQIIIRRLSEFRDSGRRRLFPARGAANIVDIVIAYVSAVTVASLVFSFGSAVVEFMTGLWGGDELESLSRRNYSDYIVFTVIIWFILLQIAFPFVALASLFYVPQGKWGLGVCVVAGGLVSIIIYKVMAAPRVFRNWRRTRMRMKCSMPGRSHA
ncbi:MAG: hypothetical protein AAF986_09915 [Pseudomonadota bacterium]